MSKDPILDLGFDLRETYSLGQISKQLPVKWGSFGLSEVFLLVCKNFFSDVETAQSKFSIHHGGKILFVTPIKDLVFRWYFWVKSCELIRKYISCFIWIELMYVWIFWLIQLFIQWKPCCVWLTRIANYTELRFCYFIPWEVSRKLRLRGPFWIPFSF